MQRFLALILALSVLSQCTTRPEAPPLVEGVSWTIAEDRAQRLTQVHYQLSFEVPTNPKAPIAANMVVDFILSDASTPLYLDFTQPTDQVAAWWINGDSVAIDHRQDHLVVAHEYLQEGTNEVRIAFTAGSESLNRQEEFMYSLLVPDRASTVFPCFDQPNIKATFDLSLTLEAGWQPLANGPLQATDTLQDGRVRHTFGTSDRIPTYLFTFVAGDFAVLEETRDGFTMQMLHRESDTDKVEQNAPAIFDEHFRALRWLEQYTGIAYPYQKFGFALIPNFQYGGMEHVGAIHYRATSLMLDESATLNNRLGRTRLIAHETAHMWFGNLVTMEWFNDVWMKEVFANFMADKVARELYPDIDHDLNFLMAHYPAAYSVDRTQGANPIRQQLDNLKLAGTMYGNIIYHKAPIVVRQLEYQIGEAALQNALQDYLTQHAHANADWLDLLTNLTEQNEVFTEAEFRAWHEVWVADAGMPTFALSASHTLSTEQKGSESRIWPQVFAVGYGEDRTEMRWNETRRDWQGPTVGWNSTGLGYGVFPIDSGTVQQLPKLTTALERGSTLINAYENMISGREVSPVSFLSVLLNLAATETDPQVLNRAMGYAQTTYWTLLSPTQRTALLEKTEDRLWAALKNQSGQDRKKPVYEAYVSIAQSEAALSKLYAIWEGKLQVPGLILSVPDKTDLALQLALKRPERYPTLIATQQERISNRDRRARFAFEAVAVHPNKAVRDSLFATYSQAENRALEPWVLSSLRWLHHPLRQADGQHYLPQALAWLEDIQKTGDIFFPKRWLDTNFGPYQAPEVVALVETFLVEHPDYSPNLRAKILQAYDPARRAALVVESGVQE